MLQNDVDFNQLIFSDEPRFALTSDNRCRWYRKSDRDDQVFEEKEKFTTSIMVFGAIGMDFKSKLVICERSVNALYYRDILEESGLIQDLNESKGEGNWTFIQDGATAHTSEITKRYLKKRMRFMKI